MHAKVNHTSLYHLILLYSMSSIYLQCFSGLFDLSLLGQPGRALDGRETHDCHVAGSLHVLPPLRHLS